MSAAVVDWEACLRRHWRRLRRRLMARYPLSWLRCHLKYARRVPGCEVSHVRGKLVLIHPSYTERRRQSLRKHSYEHDELKVIDRLFASGVLGLDEIVLEFGSGIGIVAMHIADNLSSGRVHSYEANPALIGHSRLNHAINGYRIDIDHAALHPEMSGCSAPFFIDQDFSGSSLVPAESRLEEIRVPTKRLEEEIRAHGATAIFMDIEGAEVDVLRHCRDFGRVRVIACEIHPRLTGVGEIASMREVLGAHGFRPDPGLSVEEVEVFIRG